MTVLGVRQGVAVARSHGLVRQGRPAAQLTRQDGDLGPGLRQKPSSGTAWPVHELADTAQVLSLDTVRVVSSMAASSDGGSPPAEGHSPDRNTDPSPTSQRAQHVSRKSLTPREGFK